MQPIDKAKAFFSERKISPLSPTEILVLKGLVSGDGDIGGRMASSSPNAKPPVDSSMMEVLRVIADKHKEFGTPISALDEIHGKTNESNP
jgi:hypothetical protein